MNAVSGSAAGMLPPAVRVVLHAAATIVTGRLPEEQRTNPDHMLSDSGGIAQLLELLQEHPVVGAATAAQLAGGQLPPDDDGQKLAVLLLSPDPTAVARGVRSVRDLLGEHRRARGRAARQAERADRETPAQREAARGERKFAELRDARDRARARVVAVETDAAVLRAEIVGLGGELAELQDRAAAAEAQLAAARRDATDPFWSAEQLAAVLAPPTPSTLHDTRGVGPGEPQRIDPARQDVPAPAVDPRRWSAAARVAGLPADVAESAASWLPLLLEAFVRPPLPVALVHERDLQVVVLGGGTEIGGSCVLVAAGNTRLLVDAGSRPGGTDADSLAPRRIAEALAAPLHAIVVTHAHNDHAGWVPAVLAVQRDLPVFATAATADLLATMWFDSAKVLARRGEPGGEPPYLKSDVEYALHRLQPTAFGRRQRVGDLEIELFPAGHIVGAAGVIVHAGNRRVVISGDVSRPGQKTVGGIEVPASARGAELLLLESTYANSGRRAPRAAEVDQLVRDVEMVTSAGGRVLVPAFALGRAQEVAAVLGEHLPNVEVLVDGLARDVTRVYETQTGPEGRPLQIFGSKVRRVPPGGTQAAIATRRAGVVVATSGMLTAGPAVAWARALLPDSTAGLMIVGYQDEESPGARLLALAEAGGGLFELPPSADGRTATVEVNAHVRRYGLGAHASADELVSIVSDVNPAEVMLVHGVPAGQRVLANRLDLRGQTTARTGVWRPLHGSDT